MGWFDEQIKARKQNDDDVFDESMLKIAGAVMGKKVYASSLNERQKTENAMQEILKYYHLKMCEIPGQITDVNEQLEYIMRPHGFMYRKVKLDYGWYKDAIGAMLGTRTDNGSVVALIPSTKGGYYFVDYDTGEKIKIGKNNQRLIDTEATAFYKPFPLKAIGLPELIKYMIEMLSVFDIVLLVALTGFITMIGMIGPKISHILFSQVVPSQNMRILIAATVFLVSSNISRILIGSIKNLFMARIKTKLSLSVEAATLMRVLSLPPAFFKDYNSGELSSRAKDINSVCMTLMQTVLSTGLTSVFSLTYIAQIFQYTPSLVAPALIIVVITVVFAVLSALVQMNLSRKQLEYSIKESGMSYALITGIQKIKLAGAEKRAFAKWGNLYAEDVELSYNPPMFIKINDVINTGIALTGTLVMYYFSLKNNITLSDYYAFNTAYALVRGAFMSLATTALQIARIKPSMEMIKPILNTVPEVSEGKQAISRLNGEIELNNVSFRYNKDMPFVIDNLSLKIRPGQYVALVGATGCGKSTLMRLLLGFEVPEKGAVYYDGKDLSTIDVKSLRHRIGSVIQNGKLFSGDIFSNIIISAPWLKMSDAWEAAEMAGIADDIRSMPMGMHTIISEGSGGISGGQRQRLMIARAIAPKPKILMFDEATSALDNVTQKKVSQSLDSLKCTRIVIAHRLSTIRQCDRIVLLDHGKIAEDGTYDELIEKNGLFAELVAKQRIDV